MVNGTLLTRISQVHVYPSLLLRYVALARNEFNLPTSVQSPEKHDHPQSQSSRPQATRLSPAFSNFPYSQYYPAQSASGSPSIGASTSTQVTSGLEAPPLAVEFRYILRNLSNAN
jgi:hypothetical protein